MLILAWWSSKQRTRRTSRHSPALQKEREHSEATAPIPDMHNQHRNALLPPLDAPWPTQMSMSGCAVYTCVSNYFIELDSDVPLKKKKKAKHAFKCVGGKASKHGCDYHLENLYFFLLYLLSLVFAKKQGRCLRFASLSACAGVGLLFTRLTGSRVSAVRGCSFLPPALKGATFSRAEPSLPPQQWWHGCTARCEGVRSLCFGSVFTSWV